MNEQHQHDDIDGAAAQWLAASLGPEMDWDGFTAWLEADPRHRDAYDAMALIDARIVHRRAALAEPAAAEPVKPASRWLRAGWLAMPAAAAAAALLLLRPVPPTSPAVPDRMFTAQATPLTVALGDGSRVVLAPRSRLAMIGGKATTLRLDGGGWFDIRHRPGRELAIAAGPVTIADIGTRFDLRTDGATTRLAVADGQVAARGAGLAQPLRVSAGHALLIDAAAGNAEVSDIATATVGAWRHGQLDYDNVPLPLVAADLARYAGVRMAVAPELQGRRFTGTLSIRNADNAAQDLAAIMGLDLRRDRGGAVLLARHR